MRQDFPGLAILKEPNDFIGIHLSIHKWGVIGQVNIPFLDGPHGGGATAEQPCAGNRSGAQLTWLLTRGPGQLVMVVGSREMGQGGAVALMPSCSFH